METKTLIKPLLRGQHAKFWKYCEQNQKSFVEDLTRDDFIMYRLKCFSSYEEIDQIKSLLDFHEPEPEDSLRKYFKLKSFKPYKDVLISKLAFNARVKYSLKSMGYRTLAELLNASYKELAKVKGFDRSSMENIIATLNNFFEARWAKVPMEAFKIANKDIDKQLRNAAMNHDPQVGLIMTAFREFAVLATKRAFVRNKIRQSLKTLPDNIKNKKVRLLLRSSGLDNTKFFASVDDDLTLIDLPAYLDKVAFNFNPDELINFGKDITFDLQNCAKKIADDPFKDSRERDMVLRRAKGAKLKAIGDLFFVSRERVRQMEYKIITTFYKSCLEDLKKLLYAIHAMTDGKTLLTLDDVKNFINEEDAEIIWFLAEKVNFRSDVLHFDEEFKAFVFNDGVALNEAELFNGLPNIIEDKFIDNVLEELSHEKDCPVSLLKTKLPKFYDHKGKVFYRERLTLTAECGYILKAYFQTGYKIALKSDFTRFVNLLQEIFEENAPLNQRSLDANIMRVGVLCNRGKYLHPDFVHVPREIIDRVKDFIEASERTAISYKEIYQSLKSIFVGTQITNHYFLQGAIRFYRLPYILRKDYLTKIDEITIATEFNKFVAERGVVSLQEIKEHFVSFEKVNIAFLLQRCPEVIRIGNGDLMHTSLLSFKDEDFEPIKEFLAQNCSQPVHSRFLFDMFVEHFPDFVTRNEIDNHGKMFGILNYMFKDEFNFSHPYISMPGIKNVDSKMIFLNLLKDKDEITIEEFLRLCKESTLKNLNKVYLLERLHPKFIRVDKDTLRRPESIGVTDEVITEVEKKICAAIDRNGGWQPASTFKEYDELPQLKIPWNVFLLEGVVSLCKDSMIHKLKIATTRGGFSTLFVSKKFADDTFKSFVQKILIAEHEKKPFGSEEEIFLWLQERGLCYSKLPAFLSGKILDILGVVSES